MRNNGMLISLGQRSTAYSSRMVMRKMPEFEHQEGRKTGMTSQRSDRQRLGCVSSIAGRPACGTDIGFSLRSSITSSVLSTGADGKYQCLLEAAASERIISLPVAEIIRISNDNTIDTCE